MIMINQLSTYHRIITHQIKNQYTDFEKAGQGEYNLSGMQSVSE